MKKGYIKIFDGFTLKVDGQEQRFEHVSDILEQVFHWDLENDPAARECFGLINRELFCFHRVDLSRMAKGDHTVEIIGIESTDDIVWTEETEV